jgi:hypothetical protein
MRLETGAERSDAGFTCPQDALTADTQALAPRNAEAPVEKDEPATTRVTVKTTGLDHLISLPRLFGCAPKQIRTFYFHKINRAATIERARLRNVAWDWRPGRGPRNGASPCPPPVRPRPCPKVQRERSMAARRTDLHQPVGDADGETHKKGDQKAEHESLLILAGPTRSARGRRRPPCDRPLGLRPVRRPRRSARRGNRQRRTPGSARQAPQRMRRDRTSACRPR